ncbi:MAG: hypothetical protein WCO00_17480 [Rhodospirillaceae bacterium]
MNSMQHPIRTIQFLPVPNALFVVLPRGSVDENPIAVVSSRQHALALARGANENPGADFIVKGVLPNQKLTPRKDKVDAALLNAAESIFDVKLEGVEVAS